MKALVYECHLRYEDGLWTAHAPDISGCYGVGRTKRTAVADLKSAIAAMSNTSKRKTVDDVVRLKITKEEVIALRKLSSPPPTDRLKVQIPAELRAPSQHLSRTREGAARVASRRPPRVIAEGQQAVSLTKKQGRRRRLVKKRRDAEDVDAAVSKPHGVGSTKKIRRRTRKSPERHGSERPRAADKQAASKGKQLSPKGAARRRHDPDRKIVMASQAAVDDLAPYVERILTVLEEVFEVDPGEWAQGALVSDESWLSDFFDCFRDQSHDQALYDQIGQKLGMSLDKTEEDDRVIVRVALRLKRAAERSPS